MHGRGMWTGRKGKRFDRTRCGSPKISTLRYLDCTRMAIGKALKVFRQELFEGITDGCVCVWGGMVAYGRLDLRT